MTTAKERILDAFEFILGIDGLKAATMDAVAARASVSKGGLIYHFANKEAMIDALCERLDFLVAEDLKLMQQAESPAHYYVRNSYYQGTALDRTIIAVTIIAQEGNDRVKASFDKMEQSWLDLLIENIADYNIANAIKLMGDGLYYRALLGGGQDDPKATLFATGDSVTPPVKLQQELTGMLAVVDILLASRNQP